MSGSSKTSTDIREEKGDPSETSAEASDIEEKVEEVESLNEAQSAAEEVVEVEGPAEEEPHGDLLRKLEETLGQAKKNHDRYLRAVADLENYRKRTLREKEELRKYGAAGFIEELLPILDSFKIGLDAAVGHPEAKDVTEGFALAVDQLSNVLKRYGVTEIDPEGDPFDPNLHEGVSHMPSETVDEGIVLAVTRVGYKMHERLLRPASVVVSSGLCQDDEKT